MERTTAGHHEGVHCFNYRFKPLGTVNVFFMVIGNLVGYTFGLSGLDVLFTTASSSFTLLNLLAVVFAIAATVNLMLFLDSGKGKDVEMRGRRRLALD